MRPAQIAAWLQRAVQRPLPPRDGYARWAATYPPRAHNPLMEVEQAVVAPLIASARPRRAVDVGTGSGRYLPVLAAAGARVVVGIDASRPMLGAQTPGTPRVCGDARRLPLRDASVELVCSSLMVGDLPDLGEWLAEAARVLVPGGHLIYSDFHESWAARGWRRTFRGQDGRTYELAHCRHTIEEHLRHLHLCRFQLRAIREPRLVPPDAGAGARPAGPGPSAGVPVVVVFHAVKPNGSSFTAGAGW